MVIDNASTTAIINAQKAFEESAKDFGVNSEEDVQRLAVYEPPTSGEA